MSTYGGGFGLGSSYKITPSISQTRTFNVSQPVRYNPPNPAAPPPIATLTDDFATADAAKWNYGAAATVTGGQLTLTPNTSYSGLVQSDVAYDLTADEAIIELVQSANLGNGTTETSFYLYTNPANLNDNAVFFDVTGSGTATMFLAAYRTVGGTRTLVSAPNYSATDHRWLRIREAAGTVYWDTSPDRSTWTNVATWAATFPLTALYVSAGTGYYGTEPTPGTAIFDNFNVSTGVPPSTGSATGTVTATGAATGQRFARGSAAGTVTTTGSATGKRAPKATASGTVTATGSAVGSAPKRGTATGTVTTTGSATGKRVAKAASVGTVTTTGSAAGARTPKATATGTVTSTGTAAGLTAHRGAATGTVTTTGSATGRRVPKASTSGTVTTTGAAVGTRTPKATAAGAVTTTGSATGVAPIVGQNDGVAVGTVTATGSAVGQRSPRATSSGVVTITGTATGSAPVVGQASGTAGGTVTITGTAAGKRFARALVLSTTNVTGTAVGSAPAVGARTGSAVGTVTVTSTAVGDNGEGVADIDVTWGPTRVRGFTARTVTDGATGGTGGADQLTAVTRIRTLVATTEVLL